MHEIKIINEDRVCDVCGENKTKLVVTVDSAGFFFGICLDCVREINKKLGEKPKQCNCCESVKDETFFMVGTFIRKDSVMDSKTVKMCSGLRCDNEHSYHINSKYEFCPICGVRLRTVTTENPLPKFSKLTIVELPNRPKEYFIGQRLPFATHTPDYITNISINVVSKLKTIREHPNVVVTVVRGKVVNEPLY